MRDERNRHETGAPRVLAQYGPRYLIKLHEDIGQVVDLGERRSYPPQSLDTLDVTGWRVFTGSMAEEALVLDVALLIGRTQREAWQRETWQAKHGGGSHNDKDHGNWARGSKADRSNIETGEIVVGKRFGAGVTSSKTYMGTVGGRTAVIKPLSGQPRRPMRRSLPAGADAEREVAAGIVNKYLGDLVLMPQVAIRDVTYTPSKRVGEITEPALVSEWIPDSEPHPFFSFRPNEVFHHDDAMNIAVFDAVIGNLDRHVGNLLTVPNAGDLADDLEPVRRMVAIDHSMAFPTKNDYATERPRKKGEPGSDGPLYNAILMERLSYAGYHQHEVWIEPSQLDAIANLRENEDAFNREIEPLIGSEALEALWERVEWLENMGQLPLDKDHQSGWEYR